jgi:HSP20 family protein
MARKVTGRGDMQDQETPRQEVHEQQTTGVEKIPAEQIGGERTRQPAAFHPRVDIYETETGLVLVADLPGVRSDGLDITLEKQVLTIHGRAEDDAPEGYSPVYREYEVGDFERHFTLGGDFDIDRIEADLRDGVLRLSIPRAPEPEARRIAITPGSTTR